ncbi:hypothetical protein AB1399_04990 [Hydrogenibacillus schlegelii]|nr:MULTISPECIES: hypothetical protein [Hydrogenibacillus]KWW97097.1 hypothetical protein TR75_10545 [Hydrogenibacillus schlegelii]MBE3562611.1 hypothetical protein [Hydrogenibacillus schlegelii]MBT9281619.1 hypothetical protein [Hydrogenibacillus schlegelii]OAR03470.1 hypothetical protein SA87_01345 [Hydrogenibacillus schlegelii]QZA34112.1 hypothetical protein K2M58_01940 [Hydrogenibacillus sp. N12]
MQFERAIQSKHTAFDDLYPYMVENPSFFWYKRYVAWTELLVLVDLAGRLGLPWESLFLPHQVQFIRAQVLSGTVLDRWFDPAGEGEDR